MHYKLLPILFAGALLMAAAQAQDSAVATPTSPAAAPQQQVPAQPAPTQIAAPAPSQVIYAPRLPSPTELTNVAAAQGLTVEQVSQTANQVTAVYRNSAGQLSSIAYQLLPTAGTPGASTVVTPSPAPTIVYQASPNVIYYDSYSPYWPGYYYPPVSLSLGFGYYHGWGRGGWGGFRGGWGHHWR